MKSYVHKISIYLTAVFLLAITGCKNFMNSSQLKEQLEKEIEYANAASYTITVAAEENTGTVTVGAAGYTKKVTDYFDVAFKKNSGWKFVEWRAVSRTDGSAMDEYVEFDDKTSLSTRGRLLKDSGDINILPFCESQISFAAAYPEYDKEGVAKDSSIKLVFTNELCEDNDFSKIKISIDGSNVDAGNYFDAPVFDKATKTLLIAAKTSNRITVAQDNTKDIIVTIPSDFTYYGSKEGKEFEIGEELLHSYRINSTTCDKAVVMYGYCLDDLNFDGENDTAGTFKIGGTSRVFENYSYNIGESENIYFKLSEHYIFNGWKCSDDSTIIITTPDTEQNPDYDSKGYNSNTNTAASTIKVIGESKETIKIIADVSLPPCENIVVSSSSGKISPAGIYTLWEGDYKSLTFTADSDYQFIGWKAYSDIDKTVEVPEENIIFSDADNNNTFITLKKVLEDYPDIYVEPVCAKRPKVVSATPSYSTEGAYRDASLVVFFDQPMSDNSIYWTANELEENGIESSDDYKITGRDGNEYYYGYKDGENVVFKNINITNFKDASKNLLIHYQNPAFDSDGKVLRIRAKLDDAPPAATEILVDLKNGFLTETTAATLSTEYSWVYFTNNNTDTDVPVFDSTTLSINFGNKDVTSRTAPLTQAEDIPLFNGQNKVLKINAKVTDSGIGPDNTLEVSVKHVSCDIYLVSGTVYTETQKLSSVPIGQTVEFKDASVELNLTDDGLYEVYLTARDKNSLTATTGPFYFVYDKTGPDVSGLSITESRTSADKTNFTFTTPAIKDIASYKITTTDITADSLITDTNPRDVESAGSEVSVASGAAITDSVTNLTNQHKYKHSFVFYDYAGNTSEPVDVVDNTGPGIITCITGDTDSRIKEFTVHGKGKVEVAFTKSSSSEYSGKTTYSTGSISSVIDTSKSTAVLELSEDVRTGSNYEITINDYDYSGNISSKDYLIVDVKPDIGMVYYSDGDWSLSTELISGKTAVGIIWKAPEDGKVTILSLEDESNFTWGEDSNSKVNFDTTSCGLDIYNAVVEENSDLLNTKKNPSKTTMWSNVYHIKNKEGTSEIIWYPPAVREWKELHECINTTSIKDNFTNIGKNVPVSVTHTYYLTANASQPNYYACYYYCLSKNKLYGYREMRNNGIVTILFRCMARVSY